MKVLVILFLALTVFSISTAKPQLPGLPALPGLPGLGDVTKIIPGVDIVKNVPGVKDIFKLIPGGSSSDVGPNNYGRASTNIETGSQSAVNKGSTNSSNNNSAYNVASKINVENAETAQAHGPAYAPPPPPPPPKYE